MRTRARIAKSGDQSIEALALGIEAGAAELTSLARAQPAALVVATHRCKRVSAAPRALSTLGEQPAQKSIKYSSSTQHQTKKR